MFLSFLQNNHNITLEIQIASAQHDVVMNISAIACSFSEPRCERSQYIWTNLLFSKHTDRGNFHIIFIIEIFNKIT